MSKNLCTLYAFCALCALCAKINPVYAQQNIPYTIPRQIFVGDPAIFVVPLPASNENYPDTAITPQTPGFPKHDYIDFHKITLERRVNASRLLIEFTAFAPGTLELPIIEINGRFFPNLAVTVDSIIDTRNALTLSAPASSLAMPGTALLLYGGMAAVIFLIIFSVWFAVKGGKLIEIWKEKWKRWRLFSSIRNTERRLYKLVLKGVDKRSILDTLSQEARDFLSVLTGVNCRSMTAREFINLPLETEEENAGFLENFFASCDKLRFSGGGIKAQDIFTLLENLRKFADKLEANINLKNSNNLSQQISLPQQINLQQQVNLQEAE